MSSNSLKIFFVLILLALATIFVNKRMDNGRSVDVDRMDKPDRAVVQKLANKLQTELQTDTSEISMAFSYEATHSAYAAKEVTLQLVELESRKSKLDQLPETHQAIYYEGDFKHENAVRILKVHFDNDIFNNTDYYFTNGAQISLITPLAKRTPLIHILPKLRNRQVDIGGFSITQNIYTPTNPDVSDVMDGDRPFSSYLTLGQFRESYNFSRNLSIKSSLNIGVLGPAALGDYVQSSIHEIEPIGWDNQIQNSLVLNYHLQIEKGLFSNPNLEVNLVGKADIGTLYNRGGGGLNIRLGSFTPVYWGSLHKEGPLQYWFSIKGELSAVAYDATLQGGLLNPNNPYTIAAADINRLVAKASIGFAVYYNNYGFEFENFYWSPEFEGAYDFRYGRLSFVAKF